MTVKRSKPLSSQSGIEALAGPTHLKARLPRVIIELDRQISLGTTLIALLLGSTSDSQLLGPRRPALTGRASRQPGSTISPEERWRGSRAACLFSARTGPN